MGVHSLWDKEIATRNMTFTFVRDYTKRNFFEELDLNYLESSHLILKFTGCEALISMKYLLCS